MQELDREAARGNGGTRGVTDAENRSSYKLREIGLMATKRIPKLALGQADPAVFDSEGSKRLVDSSIFRLRVNAAREARLEAARTVVQSRALRAEANLIVERSRAAAIKLRASNIRSQTTELPSPRKMRSLYVQAQHEYQRFFRLAAELTEVIEHCAETVTNSARFRSGN